MKGMQSMSKAAQQYDSQSTKATRNAWGTPDSTYSSRHKVSRKKYKRKTSKTKRKKYNKK